MTRFAPLALAGLTLLTMASGVHAGEAEIRKNLPQRVPGLPKIDEVREAPVKGLYEVRIGGEVIYVDGEGDHLIRGEIIQTRSSRNLTEERVGQLNAVDFDKLPFKDAIVWKNGNGKRRLVIFADPNCGYCHKIERDLQQVQDVTVYTFLIPILGQDSPQKSRDIWCAKDRTEAWRNWMLDNVQPPRFMGMACNTPLERNMTMARQYRVQATPTIFFEDGSRASGALPAPEVEKRLAAVKS